MKKGNNYKKVELRDYKFKELDEFNIKTDNNIELSKITEGKKISIISDVMFKTMFQNTSRLKYSCFLISNFIEVDYDDLLDNLVLVSNELDKDKVSSKAERCDYVANINGALINIEINNRSSRKVIERNIDYVVREYSSNIKSGEDYNYTQSIQINLNNFYYEGRDNIIEYYTLSDDSGVALTSKIIIVNVYLPLLRKKWYTLGTEGLNELEKYLLMIYEDDIEETKKLKGDLPIMKEYMSDAIDASHDKNIREIYDKELLVQEVYKEEAVKETKLEIARNMLKDNLPIETISKYTNLTIDEINSLKDEENTE